MLDKDYYAAVDDYNRAVIMVLLQIASKMGIFANPVLSVDLRFSRQLVYLRCVIDKYFTGTAVLECITLEDIEENVCASFRSI